ncbi:peptidyl-prolyl cis-trans isomerase [Bacillus sp. V59.32b]|uniref:peptidyl-prolyl cis-trans isomerase n=1 Tax=Bacillus sp. V59.32b TaxID=1758642 RepID=UPI000E3C2EE7|nr:peptidyl-prolyl cis-trans isomerase [Bacillus sp. V59.32b]RFU60502.1 peptidyl-prolyl cis-trans isomerase [Bacillus sp. V59.32b]
MESIVFIKGKVNYTITLDPGVWIFDDRKVDLETYFQSQKQQTDELEEYTKAASKHWDREIQEGSVSPPTLKTEQKYEKQKILTGTFGIPFESFLKNAEPNEDTGTVIIETETGEQAFSLTDAQMFILGFSFNGKPLSEDGPVHVYFGDGSNLKNPITKVKAFRIE